MCRQELPKIAQSCHTGGDAFGIELSKIKLTFK